MYCKILLTSVGAIALTASAAFAADLGPPPVYLPPPPVFTWTGFYMGGQAGYAWTRDNGSIDNPAPRQLRRHLGLCSRPPSSFLSPPIRKG